MQGMTFITVSLVIVSLIRLPVIAMGGAYNEIVYQAQKRLQELGYDPGLLDGFWGKTTESTVRLFQRDKGLPVTGELDEKTKEKLDLKEDKQPKVEAKKSYTEPLRLACVSPSGVTEIYTVDITKNIILDGRGRNMRNVNISQNSFSFIQDF